MALPFIGGDLWNAELKGQQLRQEQQAEQDRALQAAIQQGIQQRQLQQQQQYRNQQNALLQQRVSDLAGYHSGLIDARGDANATKIYGIDQNTGARVYNTDQRTATSYANTAQRQGVQDYRQGRDAGADAATNDVLNTGDFGAAFDPNNPDNPPGAQPNTGGVAELKARQTVGDFRAPQRTDLNDPNTVADVGAQYGQKISDLTTRNTAITNQLQNPSLSADDRIALSREQAGIQGSIQAIQVKVQSMAKQAQMPQKTGSVTGTDPSGRFKWTLPFDEAEKRGLIPPMGGAQDQTQPQGNLNSSTQGLQQSQNAPTQNAVLTPNNAPRVRNAQDYNSLPPGAAYVDPNGVMRQKANGPPAQ